MVENFLTNYECLLGSPGFIKIESGLVEIDFEGLDATGLNWAETELAENCTVYHTLDEGQNPACMDFY